MWDVLAKMRQRGVRADEFSCVIALDACARELEEEGMEGGGNGHVAGRGRGRDGERGRKQVSAERALGLFREMVQQLQPLQTVLGFGVAG